MNSQEKATLLNDLKTLLTYTGQLEKFLRVINLSDPFTEENREFLIRELNDEMKNLNQVHAKIFRQLKEIEIDLYY